MSYGELALRLHVEVLAGRLTPGAAIDQLQQYSDGGLTWQGAADLFAGTLAPLDLDGQGNCGDTVQRVGGPTDKAIQHVEAPDGTPR
ncbi:hypothetical protein OG225_42955 (plasmid) [Nocardia sp. NBC_01377]|uniref:hypothetical protein n=1 Tax=Nocardia sp. NBC_01377 TaxID=2903595 RepID=UPI0032475625